MSEKQFIQYLHTNIINQISTTYDFRNPKLRKIKNNFIRDINKIFKNSK